MKIDYVTVLGGNGTMGKNVGAIFASFGHATVYLMCRTREQAEKAVEEAAKTVRADSIRKRLIPVTYSEMAEVVPKSDLVFETVAENINVKKQINAKVVKWLSKKAVLCTGTSGLSINELAGQLPVEVAKKYMGVHFFNPPYNMVLCEVIPSETTERSYVDKISRYLKETLIRTVVEIQDQPAFAGNRIGFFFINEAFQYAEKFKSEGGVDYVDSILGGFTGRNLPPMATADFVGLDIHRAIVDNVYINGEDFSKESFVEPSYLTELIEEGMLGRKVGEGIYKFDPLEKKKLVYDISEKVYRESREYDIPFRFQMIRKLENGKYEEAMNILKNDESIEAKIARDFMIRYVVYSLYVIKTIAVDEHCADDAMATGFNWIPPLAVIDAMGGKDEFLKIARVADMNHINLDFECVRDIIKKAPKSQYDYRKFLKAF